MSKEKSKIKTSLLGYSRKSVDKAIEILKEENEQELKRSREFYENQLSEYREKLNTLENQIETEQCKLDPLLKENADLKYKNDAINTKLVSISSELDSVKNELTEKNKALTKAAGYKSKIYNDYSNILNNYNKIRKDVTTYTETINRKNLEIDTLNSRLNKSEMLYNSFIDSSKQCSSDIITSGSLFDEKISALKNCIKQINEICLDTENVFNEVFIQMANFIMLSSSKLTDEENNDPSDIQKIS